MSESQKGDSGPPTKMNTKEILLQQLVKFNQITAQVLIPDIRRLLSQNGEALEAELASLSTKIKGLETKISRDTGELEKLGSLKESLSQGSKNTPEVRELEPILSSVGMGDLRALNKSAEKPNPKETSAIDDLVLNLRRATYTGGGELKALMDEYLHLRKQLELSAPGKPTVSMGAPSSTKPLRKQEIGKAALSQVGSGDASKSESSRNPKLEQLVLNLERVMPLLPSKSDYLSLNQWDSSVSLAHAASQRQAALDLSELTPTLWTDPQPCYLPVVGYIKTLSGEMTAVLCEKKILRESMERKIASYHDEQKALAAKLFENERKGVGLGVREVSIIDQEKEGHFSVIEELFSQPEVTQSHTKAAKGVRDRDRESLRSETMELEGDHFELQQLQQKAHNSVLSGSSSAFPKPPNRDISSLRALLTNSKPSTPGEYRRFAGEMSECQAKRGDERPATKNK